MSFAAALGPVPSEFRGTWVPTQATCQSPVRLVVTGDRLTLVNATDSETLGGIEMAGPSYFQPGYRGIMAVLFTEFSGDQPVIATFNLGEKKGVARADFAPVMPTSGGVTPQLKAYNARISKLNLVKRFPLNKVVLKKCGDAPAK
jgi:hypothetical protein